MGKHQIVFAGTSPIAKEVLLELMNSPKLAIARVYTKHSKTAVSTFAQENNLAIEYLTKFSDSELQFLQEQHFKLLAVVDFGVLIPSSILNVFQFGAFNLHFSLLPKLRGASPVQSAILNGQNESGYTIFQLVQKLDAGPILAQEKIDIQDLRADQVYQKMLKSSAPKMRQQLEKIVTEKQLNLTKQIEEEVTFAQKFSKADGEINFKKDSRATVYRKIKAFYPWPSVFFAEPRLGFVKLLDAKDPNNVEIPITVPPGKLAKIQNRVFLGLKDGPLEISELQKAGKQKLKAAEFAKGLQ